MTHLKRTEYFKKNTGKDGGFRKITPEKMGGMAESPERPHYPTFHLGLKHIPEAEKWKIGNEYQITLKVRQTGLNINKGMNGKDHGNADFDILAIKTG